MTVYAVCAQDTIRMMQYNLMYYTNTSGVSDCNVMTNNLDNKDAHIKTIFRYVQPTVMCVCELGSNNQYADRLLNNAINTDGIDYYRRGPLTSQSGGTIANMIYYDSRKLTLYKSANITTAYRDITRSTKSPDEFLDALAARLYGNAAVPFARKAWTAFSKGFEEYPFSVGVLYSGPHHVGPANPLYLKPTGYSATMVGIPYDSLKSWRSIYPEQVYVDQMSKVADGFAKGCAAFERMLDACKPELRENAKREAGMFRAACLHFKSSADQARFVMARDRRLKAGNDQEREEAGKEMREIVVRELATAKALLPLVQADSRIGYECSNHYFYTPQDVREKILCCRAIMADMGAPACR